MLQYIINTSIIWLAFLLLYELLLRKESFHQYNRAYLLISLAAGLLLPMVKISSLEITNHSPVRPLAALYETKKASPKAPVIQAGQISDTHLKTSFDPELMIWMIYLAGVLAGVILIGRESWQLRRMYRDGHKSSEAGCTIVETGNNHSPYSFFSLIFIRSKLDYDLPQWKLLVAHEKEHSHQLHSLDNLLLIFIRIIFWFHPLPHIYYRKLMLVHEFQADRAAAIDTADYGSFLLEQSFLCTVPTLTHSLNYSPIKKRIAMLTGIKSKRTRLIKYLSVVPLSLLLVVFCTQPSFSDGGHSTANKANFKGNQIEFHARKLFPMEYSRDVLQKQKHMLQYSVLPDSFPVENLVTHEVVVKPVPIDMTPVAINGNPIFGDEINTYWPNSMLPNSDAKYTAPVFTRAEKNIDKYLFSKLQNEFNKLEDGVYALGVSRLVIDEKGYIAYYDMAGTEALYGSPAIRSDIKNTIDNTLIEALNGPIKFKPAIRDGKPVNVRMAIDLDQVEVRGHQAQLRPKGGC